MAAEPNVLVIPARSLPINNKTLYHLRNVAHDARRGDATPAEAEFLLSTAGPLLDELIAWRNFAAGTVPAAAMIEYLGGRL
ncbi:MAG: hypothetical protein DI533_04570 [Cereibacter sphaeroides]|uniref:Uncharacterized protein n=1 Tax=Cereibacter sphaeroides TaxID=1063 RepID=A0A2W5UQ50_CERSP|nr:MAG: hypothetical protein DI533_04570 [Cereibacter sphaeroides]